MGCGGGRNKEHMAGDLRVRNGSVARGQLQARSSSGVYICTCVLAKRVNGDTEEQDLLPRPARRPRVYLPAAQHRQPQRAVRQPQPQRRGFEPRVHAESSAGGP